MHDGENAAKNVTLLKAINSTRFRWDVKPDRVIFASGGASSGTPSQAGRVGTGGSEAASFPSYTADRNGLRCPSKR